MMHLSQAHDTQRQLDAVKCFVVPVIFVVSVHRVERHVEDQGREGGAGKQGFCFQHSSLYQEKPDSQSAQDLVSFVHKRSANIVSPRSVCCRYSCKAPYPLFLLLKGRTGL